MMACGAERELVRQHWVEALSLDQVKRCRHRGNTLAPDPDVFSHFEVLSMSFWGKISTLHGGSTCIAVNN